MACQIPLTRDQLRCLFFEAGFMERFREYPFVTRLYLHYTQPLSSEQLSAILWGEPPATDPAPQPSEYVFEFCITKLADKTYLTITVQQPEVAPRVLIDPIEVPEGDATMIPLFPEEEDRCSPFR